MGAHDGQAQGPSPQLSDEALLFGESQSRAVISVSSKNLKIVEDMIKSHSYPFQVIGKVSGRGEEAILKINQLIQSPVRVLSHSWRNAIGRRMES